MNKKDQYKNYQKCSIASVMSVRSLLKEDSKFLTMEIRNQKFRSNYLLVLNMGEVQFFQLG